MTRKLKAGTQRRRPEDTLNVTAPTEKPRSKLLAEVGFTSPTMNALTARAFLKGLVGDLDVSASVEAASAKVTAVQAGNMTDMEGMLAAQEIALDTIFNEMARRASMNMGDYLSATETYMRMALKAQAQCRATIETLAEVKNPRAVAFVRQTNIAAGPQQVNNGGASSSISPDDTRAEHSADRSNKVMAVEHEQRMDSRAAGAAVGVDSELATVDAVNRTENRSG